jgi:outer membrane biosynthesis protein TonB
MIKPSQKEGSLAWFLALSFALNAGAVFSGYWLQIPRETNPILLTAVDINDLPAKGDPEAQQLDQPPQPEPTPPLEPDPTPPPLDSTPEFEIPAPTPTPVPSPQSRPKQSPKLAKQPVAYHPDPAATPGNNRGVANGVNGGKRNGGSRTGLFLQQPRPPYPSAAREMQIAGDVTVTLTISSGRIVAAHGNGPAILASAAASWIRANWIPAPDTSGTYELPIIFRLN